MIWTRLLSVMLGATVYTFSIILGVFLIGLGLGSGIASQMSRQMKRPRVALGVCQILLAAAIAWTAYTLADAAAQLADQSPARPERGVQFSGRHHALHVGDFSGRVLVGREFPLRASRGRVAQ